MQQFGASLVIVTHNLGVVARYVQRIYVMYAGRVVEEGTTKDIFGRPRHPYTLGLLRSVPRLDEVQGTRLVPIEGMPPNLIDMPGTCAFLPRCPYAVERCRDRPLAGAHARWAMATASAATSTWRNGTLNQPSPDPQEVLRLDDLAVHFPITAGSGDARSAR